MAVFLLGLFFGLALGPCTFFYLAPVLAICFKFASTEIIYGIFLLLLYAIGHCTVIVFAGTSTGFLQRYMDWNEKSIGSSVLKNICGVLVLIAGLYLLYKA